MPDIRKAVSADYDAVARLIHDHHNPDRPHEYWRRLFIDHWAFEFGHFGYVACEGDEIIGFLGLIQSRRMINGIERKVSNLCTWVVHDEYRNFSLMLLFTAMREGDPIITNMTPSLRVLEVLQNMGFQTLEDKMIIVPPMPWLNVSGKSRLLIPDTTAQGLLSADDEKLLIDHKDICSCYIIKGKGENCLVIAKRRIKRNIPFLFFHHIGDSHFFSQCIHRHALEMCLRNKTVALLLDKRMLKGNSVFGYELQTPVPTLYHSNDPIAAGEIDNLYSEFVLF